MDCPECDLLNSQKEIDDWQLCPSCLKEVEDYISPIRRNQKYIYKKDEDLYKSQ